MSPVTNGSFVPRAHHIGLIVPSSNRTMETELPALMRMRAAVEPEEHFIFHSSRMRMQHVTPEQLVAMNQQTPRAAAEIADVRPDVVATACLVAIMAQGPGFHCTAEDEIGTVLRQEGSPPPSCRAPARSSLVYRPLVSDGSQW